MRLTSRGRVTIPLKIREEFGLSPGDEVDFVLDEHGLHVVKRSRQPVRADAVEPITPES
ncbi:AbrB/MazE/SpoVT family DNA-binding domain-containing protein [Kutzneria sp. NPDC051319]|uniref:AbrB/MazE/SpoVT family DNA-binding domain-containing protein n=1 Tax=Kutzneria sp. NPDC051319 TaxID=3155047 RepID=UPI00341C488D